MWFRYFFLLCMYSGACVCFSVYRLFWLPIYFVCSFSFSRLAVYVLTSCVCLSDVCISALVFCFSGVCDYLFLSSLAVFPCLALPCVALHYLTSLALPYLTLPHLTSPYFALSYLIIPYLALPCVSLFSRAGRSASGAAQSSPAPSCTTCNHSPALKDSTSCGWTPSPSSP